jgi:dihydroflavonol-4-reductase
MNILITGGTGFLGSRLCQRLMTEDHRISILRRPLSKATATPNLPIRYETGDVMDVESVRRATREQHVVIHAVGGVTGNGAREDSYNVNVVGTQNVVDACIENNVGRMLHVSSVAAIGIPENAVPANEDFRFNLTGSKLYYHLSKYRAEGVVAGGAARGLNGVIVNPGTIWGPFGSSYRGSDILRMVRGARTLRCSPGGVCVVHVDDVVDGIVAALTRGISGHRYILGGDNLFFREWMLKIADAMGVSPRLIPFPGIVTDVLAAILGPLSNVDQRFHAPYLRCYLASRSTFYDSSKAATDLGYKPRAFEAVLEECVKFLRDSARETVGA